MGRQWSGEPGNGRFILPSLDDLCPFFHDWPLQGQSSAVNQGYESSMSLLHSWSLLGWSSPVEPGQGICNSSSMTGHHNTGLDMWSHAGETVHPSCIAGLPSPGKL